MTIKELVLEWAERNDRELSNKEIELAVTGIVNYVLISPLIEDILE